MGLGPDPNVSRKLPVILFLYANVDEGVLPKDALGIQVGSKITGGAC